MEILDRVKNKVKEDPYITLNAIAITCATAVVVITTILCTFALIIQAL